MTKIIILMIYFLWCDFCNKLMFVEDILLNFFIYILFLIWLNKVRKLKIYKLFGNQGPSRIPIHVILTRTERGWWHMQISGMDTRMSVSFPPLPITVPKDNPSLSLSHFFFFFFLSWPFIITQINKTKAMLWK